MKCFDGHGGADQFVPDVQNNCATAGDTCDVTDKSKADFVYKFKRPFVAEKDQDIALSVSKAVKVWTHAECWLKGE